MAVQPIRNSNTLELNDKSPFVESGASTDEIVLMFDEGNELFVSQNFLSYASPVFEAMFQKGFKELEERSVRLRGKDREYMLELFKCIHPAMLKPIDRSNALRLLPLADEYQMSVIEDRCETVLKKWLEEMKTATTYSNISSTRQYQSAEVSLKVLSLAVMLNHDDLLKASKSVLSLCRFKAITGVYFTTGYEQSNDDPSEHRENCAKIFGELPYDIQISILISRLQVCDIK